MSTVFVDIDTQCDFMLPAGALYVPGAERLLGAVARLNSFAAAQGFPLISTMDAHTENDPEFSGWRSHCVAGTLGQRKPPATLLEARTIVPSRPCDVEPGAARQFLVEKQALDCFTNPNLATLLDRLGADRFVVYGVVTEYCVRHAVLGLGRYGRPVQVVADAVATLKEKDGEQAWAEFLAAGARPVTTAAVCG